MKAASLLAWMAFCFHQGLESAKVESNQVVNLALRLCSMAFRPGCSCCDLVASKFPILAARDGFLVSWDLITFLDRLGRYSMGPKTLSGMLRWPSHLSALCTIWAFRDQIVKPILLWVWESNGQPCSPGRACQNRTLLVMLQTCGKFQSKNVHTKLMKLGCWLWRTQTSCSFL